MPDKAGRRAVGRKAAIRAIDRLLFEGRQPDRGERDSVGWRHLVTEGLLTTASDVRFGPRCGAALGISVERQSVCWALVNDPTGSDILSDKEPMPIAPIGRHGLPEPPRLPPEEFVRLLGEALAQARERAATSALAGVGVAWPSAITQDGQPTYESHHPDFVGRDIHADIRRAVAAAGFHAIEGEQAPLPILFINDADADLLFESRWGVARGKRDVLGVKLCGGVGGAVLCDGQLMRGAHGCAGEIKHTPVRWDNALRLEDDYAGLEALEDLRPCECGGKACVGRFASGRAIIDTLIEYQGPDYNVSGTLIEERSTDHSDAARITAVFTRAGKLLGEALIGPVRLLDPQLVVVNAFPHHESLTRSVVDGLTETGKVRIEEKDVRCATPGSHVTAAGAARLVVEERIVPLLEGADGFDSPVRPYALSSSLRLHIRPPQRGVKPLDDAARFVWRYRPTRS